MYICTTSDDHPCTMAEVLQKSIDILRAQLEKRQRECNDIVGEIRIYDERFRTTRTTLIAAVNSIRRVKDTHVSALDTILTDYRPAASDSDGAWHETTKSLDKVVRDPAHHKERIFRDLSTCFESTKKDYVNTLKMLLDAKTADSNNLDFVASAIETSITSDSKRWGDVQAKLQTIPDYMTSGVSLLPSPPPAPAPVTPLRALVISEPLVVAAPAIPPTQLKLEIDESLLLEIDESLRSKTTPIVVTLKVDTDSGFIKYPCERKVVGAKFGDSKGQAAFCVSFEIEYASRPYILCEWLGSVKKYLVFCVRYGPDDKLLPPVHFERDAERVRFTVNNEKVCPFPDPPRTHCVVEL
jgi:hypothetical protein